MGLVGRANHLEMFLYTPSPGAFGPQLVVLLIHSSFIEFLLRIMLDLRISGNKANIVPTHLCGAYSLVKGALVTS